MLMQLLTGNAFDLLTQVEDDTVDCCLTSPPYWGARHRSYGPEAHLGSELDPSDYITHLTMILSEVRRALKPTGTLFLNLGDSYLHKEPLGLPWRIAQALRREGWKLRQEIIWAKPNPLPEPVEDRFIRSHESIFLLTKGRKYYWDFEATRERGVTTANAGADQRDTRLTHEAGGGNYGLNAAKARMREELRTQGFVNRTRRDVWIVPTQPGGGHFAVMPERLAELCILPGCPKDGLVMDPFCGSGTSGVVALQHGRRFLGMELNPAYARIAKERLAPHLFQAIRLTSSLFPQEVSA